jgi:hypothetical protein
MSKSISGLGTTDLTINELRLLGGTFTTLNTSDLFVTGTAQIGNIIITGTFNVGQLTADAVTTPELIATGTISIKALDDPTDNDNKIAFIQGGTDTGLLKTSTGLYYNPNSDTLTAGNLTGNVTGDVTGNLTGDVTATTIGTANITASGTTTITALNNTTADFNNRVPFIDGDTTNTGVLVTRGNFNYNTATQTLNCGTFNGTTVVSQDITTNGIITDDITLKAVQVIPETSTYNFDYRLLFLRTGTPDPNISQAVSLYFNPSTSKLHVPEIVTDTATAVTTITDTLNLKAVEATATGANCRLCFFDGVGTTGSSYNIVKSGNLYFNVANSILVTNRIQAQIQMNSPLFVMMVPTALSSLTNSNASIGLYNHSGTVRNRYQHAGGHLFMDGNVGNNLIMTNTAQTRIYNPLQCDDDVTISGTLTASVLNIGTQTATNFSVVNDITVGGDTILSNVPTATSSFPLNFLVLGGTTIQKSSGITFTPSTSTLGATNMSLPGNLTLPNLFNITALRTYELLVKDTSDDTVKTTTTAIKAGVNPIGGNHFLEADELRAASITLNGLPLNNTETYNTATWATASNGAFGGGVYLSVPSGGTLKQYGYGSLLDPSGGIFSFKSSSASEWGFTNSAYDGLYEINISCYFQNNSNQRLVPRLNLYRWRNGSYSQPPMQLHADSSYIRMDVGKVNSIGLRGKIHLTSVDTFRIPTLINIHASTDFGSDQIASSLFDGTDFVISMTYLGKLTETVTT